MSVASQTGAPSSQKATQPAAGEVAELGEFVALRGPC